MRIWKWIVLGVVALVVILVLAIYFSLNGIVRSTVQKQATSSLNLETTVGGANLSLIGTSLGLSNVQIASPQGFSAPEMFTLDGLHVDVSLGQLRQDPIRIAAINIKQPTLVIEQSGGKFNFQALMSQPSKAPPDNSQPMKLIIDDLVVSDAKVVLRPDIPGVAQEIPVTIPTLEMKGVGTGEGNQNGAAIKDVVMDVIMALSSKAADSDQIPPEVRQLLKLNVDQIAAQLKDQVTQQIGNITGDLTKKLPGDVGKSIDQGIGGLLKETSKPSRKEKKK